jgi:hypothetical protein
VSVVSEYSSEGCCEVKQLCAGPVSSRSSDRASYGEQRRRGVELANGSTESQAGQMLLAAWLGWAVERLVHSGQHG